MLAGRPAHVTMHGADRAMTDDTLTGVFGAEYSA
jgi:hypothetical protein